MEMDHGSLMGVLAYSLFQLENDTGSAASWESKDIQAFYFGKAETILSKMPLRHMIEPAVKQVFKDMDEAADAENLAARERRRCDAHGVIQCCECVS